jgi:hypothetical protein
MTFTEIVGRRRYSFPPVLRGKKRCGPLGCLVVTTCSCSGDFLSFQTSSGFIEQVDKLSLTIRETTVFTSEFSTGIAREKRGTFFIFSSTEKSQKGRSNCTESGDSRKRKPVNTGNLSSKLFYFEAQKYTALR